MTKQELFEKIKRSEAVEIEIRELAGSPAAMMHVNKIQALGVEYQALSASIRGAVKVTLLAGMFNE